MTSTLQMRSAAGYTQKVSGLHAFKPARPARPPKQLVCRAQHKEVSLSEIVGTRLAAAGAAALLTLGNVVPAALANEFDILSEPTPTSNYIIDDAGVLNKTTRKGVNDELAALEQRTGYRLEVATVRKLEFSNDAFAFGDKIIEKWYPTKELGDKKGFLLVITSAKDGALTGGPAFMQAVGDDLIDSLIGDTIPILTEDEKFNETVTTSVRRLDSVLSGQADPGGPQRKDNTRRRTYRTKQETESKKGVTSILVGTLLFIAVVVPMLQYYGYTSKD